MNLQSFFRDFKGTVSCSCGDKCIRMVADGKSYVFAAIGAGLMSSLRHSALLIVPDQLRRRGAGGKHLGGEVLAASPGRVTIYT